MAPSPVMRVAAGSGLGEFIGAFDGGPARLFGLLGRGRVRAAYLFAGGVVVRRDGWVPFSWDELESVTVSGVQRSAGRPVRWRFAVRALDGTGFVLDGGLRGVRGLGEYVAREVAVRAARRDLRVIEDGGTVRAGPFTVDQGGVAKEGDYLPWRAVREVGVENGVVFVLAHDGLQLLSALAGQVPNVAAFVGVCEEMVEREVRGSGLA